MSTNLKQILTSSYKADLVNHLKTNPHIFEELVLIAMAKEQPYAKKAVWLLWSCMTDNDARIKKFIPDIVSSLQDRSDSEQRDWFIVLEKMDIKEEYQAILFNSCSNIWEKVNKQASVRFNAFKLMIKIARNHSELYQELEYLTEDRYLITFSETAKKSILNLLNN